MTVVLFEDETVSWLDPVTLSKPAFAISCGSYRLIDLVARLGHAIRWIIRPHLEELQRANFALEGFPQPAPRAPVWMVNASLVPSVSVFRRLEALVTAGRAGIVYAGNRVAAAVLAPDSPAPPDTGCLEELPGYFEQLKLPVLEADLPLVEYPHDILRHHLEILGENLKDRLAGGAYREVADGLFVGPGVQLGDYLVSDTRSGPIVLEEGATLGPHCYLRGPAHIGRRARVIEHSAIKDAVALGHTTKVGGEVEASIIEPYTNKQHHGFLGHSYLGSWINLGAGTCNSDLKNTYGQVNMEYHGRKVPTGMQFLGCIMGDYSKTAINTGIFTGKVIGVSSMLYGFVTTNVPSFVNYARLFGQVTEAPVDVAVAAQARMFARRNVVQRPCDVQLLHDMHALTQAERHIAGEPLIL